TAATPTSNQSQPPSLQSNSNLRDLLSDLARSKRIKALVLDFFCKSAVRVAGVVLELKMDEPRDGVTVSADELANRVVELMTDSERGKAVRDRVTAMKEAAAAAMSVNGSSHVAVTKLVESFKQG
ncbi:UDP-glycosyltransferase 1, partial [Linum grandiflorum]